ncbi:NosR/NirI family protein [Sulfitobacter mediterraneus]|uniref:FMN-binding protein n=1 Tax=Sulfitobacter mediterraneus TaxID=83219 RepID=A0A061SNT9_9RHOB|nr:NosR/NirI family protein [Sulfitobacter mediterraneus]KAJ02522.1 FMN-binding protein [Sulfitobacter mediterraneus]
MAGCKNWGRAIFGMIGPVLLCLMVLAGTAQSDPIVEKFIPKVPIDELVPGADAYGPMHADLPVLPAQKGGKTIGYVFLTSDFVTTTGYSGKPIHVLMGVDNDAKVTGVNLVKHSEPIVLIGIPNSEIKAVTESYKGMDLTEEAASGGSAHELDIVSGATVTIMVIDDSIVRAGIKVARQLGLGGLQPTVRNSGPQKTIKRPEGAEAPMSDWQTLDGDGSIRTLRLDVGQVNQAFIDSGDARAIARPDKGAPEDTFIEMHVALASAPEIGRTLLGDDEYANLQDWLEEGEEAILVLGRGKYSFKGSGYVRGGIFDRIQLIQQDNSARFFDKQQRRLGRLAPDDAPSFTELDIFKIPADIEFDPAEPFRLQLLVQRAVGAIDKTFITFDLGYRLPDRYLEVVTPAAAPSDTTSAAATSDPDELSHLWLRIWEQKQIEVALLVAAIGVLTVVFFFQMQVTRNARFAYWFRIGFLSFTLIVLGWYSNAQLSVVNVLAFFAAVTADFSWSAFLMDPLVFILWFSVAASLLFWGRGVFCGWLCPFGALQELSNKIARFFKVPQITVPWGLHERLWPIKYMIFLGLFGLSLYSLEMAERYAEVEPFKTAIILKFQRSWPYVLFAVALLGAGLFIERFYCRYLCPLGAALAIPGRLRMFDWLKRYKECGSPCQRCAKECMVQAIHPEGNINPNECHQCLHCQVLYQSEKDCPVCIKKAVRRARDKANHPNAFVVPDQRQKEST